MTSTQPARSKGRRGTSPLLLLSVFLAVALAPLTAEASLPRSSLDATNSAALAGAEAVDSGQLLAANLQTPFALVAGDELEKALTCNPTPSVESLTSPEGARLEPPQLASRACDGSFTLHLEPVDFGLNPQRGPPLEIPDLHQGWFVADPKTRIGGVRLNPEDLIGGERHLNLGLYRGYLVGRPGLTEDEPPDPWGLAGAAAPKQVELPSPEPTPQPKRYPYRLLRGGLRSGVLSLGGTTTLGSAAVAGSLGTAIGGSIVAYYKIKALDAEGEAYLAETNAAYYEALLRRKLEANRRPAGPYADPESPFWTQLQQMSLSDPDYLSLFIRNMHWVEEKAKANRRVHRNSLMTDVETVGYSLRDRDTGAVLKYGETTSPEDRYSKKYLEEHNAELVIEARGSKADMHEWQNKKIVDHTQQFGKRPPLNKSDY